MHLVDRMRRLGCPPREFAIWRLVSRLRRFDRHDPRGYMLRRCKRNPVR